MEQIVRNIYDDILEMSDLELQKKLWLNENNDSELISSYTELMCRLFDDNDIVGFINNIALEKGFTIKVLAEIKLLIDLLNSYKEKQSDREIIYDPEWHKVVEQAKVVLKVWNKAKPPLAID
jgi:hypothetical protein